MTMTIAAAVLLLLCAVVVLMAGPRCLPRITASGDAPRLGVAVWLTAVVTVLGCSMAAVTLLVVETAGHWGGPDELLTSCMERLKAILLGRAGLLPMLTASAALAVAGGSVIAICIRVGKALHRMLTQTFAHADAVRLVGKPHGDVVIMNAPAPAAYCVAGRPSAIVVTTAAVEALQPPQLVAVVAHERAHLEGRHAYLVAVLRGLAAAMPRVRLFAGAAVQIGILLEMCADDAAARHHGHQPLVEGLVALSEAGAPPHGLAAAGVAVIARAERLIDPQRGFARVRTHLALMSALAAMAAAPTAIVTLALTGALVCFA